jgi:hypothetical protein
MANDTEIKVSLKDLKEILAEQSRQNAEQLKTVIEELRKPTVLEQKQLDKEHEELLQKNQERKDNAAAMIAKRESKRNLQRICSHKQKRTGRDTFSARKSSASFAPESRQWTLMAMISMTLGSLTSCSRRFPRMSCLAK